ncbi:MAG TPA: TonB-dependent receptor [Longimicrobiales bacterium]|nr:TonB-dependent receptor [Longimicrobiales bacterium]
MAVTLTAVAGALLVAQLGQATVTGKITDTRTGSPVTGAEVRFADLERIAVSDGAGRYTVAQVAPGPQHVTIHALGYGARTLHAFVPRTGILSIDVALDAQPIPVTPLRVRPPLAMKGLESAATRGADAAITLAAIRNHPLLAEPDALQALQGNGVYVRPETPGGMHVRGGFADQTLFLLDGIPILNPYHSAGLFSSWNPDAISFIELVAAAPAGELPDALSGVVLGHTRASETHHSVVGSVSTTQARSTFAGPLGSGGGYVLGLRTGFPDVLAPRDEPSYIRGETGDVLLKLSGGLLGGALSVLAFESENELDAGAQANSSDPDAPRNSFEWVSRSLGMEWSRPISTARLRVRAWSARAGADGEWAEQAMRSSRHDAGGSVVVENTALSLGLRTLGIRTFYQAGTLESTERLPLLAAFADYRAQPSASLSWGAGAALTYAARQWYGTPRLFVRWQPLEAVTLSSAYARTQQFAQSLRNPESVVGNVFPADLFVAARGAVPVAHGDQLALSIEYRPAPGARVTAMAHVREFADVVLVAPQTAGPFASSDFITGVGRAHGFSFDAAFQSATFGALAGYSWQHVRLRSADQNYVPEYGVTHVAEAGIVVFPVSTLSLKLGVSAAAGRSATPLLGVLEWESCNVLDQGCEFAGTPEHDTNALGQTRLPLYLRVDAGARKHWHLNIAGSQLSTALFATVTNVLGRRNALTYSQTDSGAVLVGMRPRALLLVGMDWRL